MDNRALQIRVARCSGMGRGPDGPLRAFSRSIPKLYRTAPHPTAARHTNLQSSIIHADHETTNAPE